MFGGSISVGLEALLLVVHHHLVKRLSIFVSSVHREDSGFPILRENRLALSGPAVHIPGVHVGVIVDLVDRHRDVVPADNLDRLSLDRSVVPGCALSFGIGFVDRDRPVGVDRAHIHFRRRSGKFGFREIRGPGSGKPACGYAGRVRRERERQKYERESDQSGFHG